MIHIIPAAGPDFVSDTGTVKLERCVGDDTLIDLTLLNRPWRRSDDKYIFVFLDLERNRIFFEALKKQLTDCEAIFLSTHTAGAACSTLSASSLMPDSEVVCVDLGDVIVNDDKISSDLIYNELILNNSVVLTFESQNKKYSYFALNKDGSVKVREKQVISSIASAGVYFFKSRNFLLEAFSRNMGKVKLMYNNLNYIAPMLNNTKKCKFIHTQVTNPYE